MMMEEIDLINLDKIEEYLMDIEKLTKDLVKILKKFKKLNDFDVQVKFRVDSAENKIKRKRNMLDILCKKLPIFTVKI